MPPYLESGHYEILSTRYEHQKCTCGCNHVYSEEHRVFWEGAVNEYLKVLPEPLIDMVLDYLDPYETYTGWTRTYHTYGDYIPGERDRF